jgi:uncharacterized membrane protein YhaH (DUF805 family)
MYALVNLIICFVLYGVGIAAFFAGQRAAGTLLMGLYIIYAFATLVPSLACAVRRLHDTNKSGWWILISLVPIIGGVWLIVLLATDSNQGDNQYGPNPKLMPSAITG